MSPEETTNCGEKNGGATQLEREFILCIAQTLWGVGSSGVTPSQSEPRRTRHCT
jgi:hypothetical protein